MRLLIVDDSSAMRAFIRRVVLLSGIPVTDCAEAADGEAALHHLRTQPVDVIFSDINMPVMDGETLVRELHDSGLLERTSVVIVSTDSTHTRMHRLLELGAAGYLHKPFTPEDLRQTIARIAAARMETAPI